eukprot:CCRYP_012461-RA/>CCRYP_012461-RA protein AED:0.10 eAED:0.10 QI:0/-1/0/1/-1/1/1/0/547
MEDAETFIRDIHATDAINPDCWNLECRDVNFDRVMIALLYGSWNARVSASIDKLPALISRMKESNPEMKNFAFASVKVDTDDVSYELSVNNASEQKFGLGAPSELPAIVFIGASSTETSGVDDKNTNKLRVEPLYLSGAKLDSLLSCIPIKDDGSINDSDTLLKSMQAAWSRLFDSAGKLRPASVKKNVVKTTISKDSEPAIRIFIAGDRSQVGKSSICMGILGALLKSGKYSPSDLAYIKPATQCEQTQLVQEFCKSKGIVSCIPIGPIVYYKGFTRAFLRGESGETSEQLLQKASDAVDELAVGKKVVIIDGVGYPAVGSITGTDNARVAKACGIKSSIPVDNPIRIPAPVLIIGKSGVGDAVDSFNINATYFSHKNIPVIGAIFNKISLDGFYSLQNCKEAIEMYFNKFQPDKMTFGFIPEIPSLVNARDNLVNESAECQLNYAIESAEAFVDQFMQYVNVDAILHAATQANRTYLQNHMATSSEILNATPRKRLAEEPSNLILPNNHTSIASKNATSLPSTNNVSLTRAQIEAMATRAGAAGG